MIDKLPKELLETLTAEQKDALQKTFDSEAKKIRESIESRMVKKSDYEELNNKFNSLNTDIEIDKQLASVPSQNRSVIKDLLNNDINKLDDIKNKYSHLFEKPDTPIEKIISSGVNTPDALPPKTIESLKEKIISGKASYEEEVEYATMLKSEIGG